MVMNRMFIGGYWSARAEELSTVARKITFFLNELQQLDEMFASLKLTAMTEEEAMRSVIEITEERVQELLRERREEGEIDDLGFCEIGFGLLLFDILNETLTVRVSFSVGSFSKNVKNVCFVEIKGKSIEEEMKNELLSVMNRVFQPETFKIEVVDHEGRQQSTR